MTKITDATGCEALAIVSDRLPKRPQGSRSKKTSKLKHTTVTFNAVVTGAPCATGVSDDQAKQVLAGQLRTILSEIEKPSARVRFAPPPRAPKVAVAAADGVAKDALMDEYRAILDDRVHHEG